MTTPNEKDLDVLEAIYNEAALVEAEEGEATPEDKAWAQQVRARLESRVAAMRQAAGTKAKDARPIRASYAAMARDALITLIGVTVMPGAFRSTMSWLMAFRGLIVSSPVLHKMTIRSLGCA